MSSRIFTALFLISIILTILYLQIAWLFTSLIFFICILACYEWIKNKFNKTFFGFLLIFNFGFWSVFWILFEKPYLDDDFVYLVYGSIIFNTALFDTFAFFVGSKFGETYIAKKISPNKTLEGLIGGLLASLFFGVIVFHNAQLPYVFAIYFVLGGFFAFMGDLLISYFKRQSGVKDTGTILPGHGGILDRIDSHLLATPSLLLIIIAIYSL